MKRQNQNTAKKAKGGSTQRKNSALAHRDQETVELFTEILDRSCPKE